jgi:hypothetical protein
VACDDWLLQIHLDAAPRDPHRFDAELKISEDSENPQCRCELRGPTHAVSKPTPDD